METTTTTAPFVIHSKLLGFGFGWLRSVFLFIFHSYTGIIYYKYFIA